MRPNILKEERNGWPAQARPDRPLPAPWTPELLVGISPVHHHALSPDGAWMAFIWGQEGNNDLWLARTDGAGWPRRLTFDRPARSPWTDASPCWSPDGRWLVYARQGDICATPIAGGRASRLTDDGHGNSSPIFSPDGQRVYFLSGRRGFNNLCYTTLAGEWPVPLTHFEADVADPQPSPDGQMVAFVYHPQTDFDRSEICLVAASGGDVRHLTGLPRVWDLHPRWSPDSRRIAFRSNRTGWQELYLFDVASGATRQLTAGNADVRDFAWSPDGKQIALVVNQHGSGSLYRLDVDSAELRVMCAEPGWHSLPQWGADGRWLTVEFQSPIRPLDVYCLVPETGEARRLTFAPPPALQAAPMVMPEFVQYPSTGPIPIPAHLFRPLGATAERPCPAVVYPHGGPIDEQTLEWETLIQWLVAKGYAVLTPNYRGSSGYSLAHQRALYGNWGIVDTEDMLAAADYLAGLDWVDGERLGIMGSSYGSYLAVLALARDPRYRYKCGVAQYGDCDILGSWAQGDRPGREDLERLMCHPAANRAGYRAGSPVYDVPNIRFPLLIMHGSQDQRVDPKQSEELVEALRREGKTFEYVVYEGEGHGFMQKGNILHCYATLERFLDWYLL